MSRRLTRRPGALFALALLCGSAMNAGCGTDSSGSMRAGRQLPPLLPAGQLLNAPIEVPEPTEGWVLYLFSPRDCPQCEENSSRVEALARALPHGWQFLGIAIEEEGLADFVDRLHVTVPVAAQIDQAALSAYTVDATPTTYVLDQGWRLLEVLGGPFEPEAAQTLEKRFRIHLALDGAPSTSDPNPDLRGKGLCFDHQQHAYSPGAKAAAWGLPIRCGAGGVWLPAG